jgi:hypothetical protein
MPRDPKLSSDGSPTLATFPNQFKDGASMFDPHFVYHAVKNTEGIDSFTRFPKYRVDFSMQSRTLLESEVHQENMCVAAGIRDDPTLSKTLNRYVRELKCNSVNGSLFNDILMDRFKLLGQMERLTHHERKQQTTTFRARKTSTPSTKYEPLSNFSLKILSRLVRRKTAWKSTLSSNKPLALLQGWLSETEKNKASFFSEWSPPEDSWDTAVEVEPLLPHVESGQHLTALVCTSSPSSLEEPLPVNLKYPGSWKPPFSGMVFTPTEASPCSEIVVRVKGGKPTAIKCIDFSFSAEFPRKLVVQSSIDGVVWFDEHVAEKPYMRRKCYVHMGNKMIVSIKIKFDHNALQGVIKPVGICDLKVRKETEGSCRVNRRQIIGDIHEWLAIVAINSEDRQERSEALNSLVSLARLSGSLCTVLKVVKCSFVDDPDACDSDVDAKAQCGWRKLFVAVLSLARKMSIKIQREACAKGRYHAIDGVYDFNSISLESLLFPSNLREMAKKLLGLLVNVAGMYETWPIDGDLVVASIDLEECYCIEACFETFDLCDTMLKWFSSTDCIKKEDERHEILFNVLQILRASFRRLRISRINPLEVGIRSSSLDGLAETLQQMFSNQSFSLAVQETAADTVSEGFDFIYGSESKRVKVITSVLEIPDLTKFHQNPGKHKFIKHVLDKFEHSIVDMLPKADEYCTAEDAENYTEPLEKLFKFGVTGTLHALDEKVSGRTEPYFSASKVEDTASKLLLNYQRHLLALFSLEQSKYTAPSRVVAVYGELLCRNCCVILSKAIDTRLKRSTIESIFRTSIIGQLLPSFVLQTCLHYRSVWLSKLLLPYLISTLQHLDALNVSFSDLSQLDDDFCRHRGENFAAALKCTERLSNFNPTSSSVFSAEKLSGRGVPIFSSVYKTGQTTLTNDKKTAKVDFVSSTARDNPRRVTSMVRTSCGVSNGEHGWEFSVKFNEKQANVHIWVADFGENYDECNLGTEADSGSYWMLSVLDGSLWHNSTRVGFLNYSGKGGDVICMALDSEAGVLRYSVNGMSLGIAFGPGSVNPNCQALLVKTKKTTSLFAGFTATNEIPVHDGKCSVVNENARVEVTIGGCGYGDRSLRLPWLLDLEKTIAASSALFASSLVTGMPSTELEIETRPWLSSQLFSSGLLDYDACEKFSVEIIDDSELGLLLEESHAETNNDKFVAIVKGFRRVGEMQNTRSYLEKCGLVHAGHILTGVRSAAGVYQSFLSLNHIFQILQESSRPVILTFSDAHKTSNVTEDAQSWQEVIDHVSNRIYYWNTSTGITSWEKPGDTAILIDTEATELVQTAETFLTYVRTENAVLEWINVRDKKGGMDKLIYKNKVLQKRLGAFPVEERSVLAAILWQSGLWEHVQEVMNAKPVDPGKMDEFDDKISEIAANVRIFRTWMRSQKLLDWAERAQVIMEEENQPVFVDQESMLRHKRRTSSMSDLGTGEGIIESKVLPSGHGNDGASPKGNYATRRGLVKENVTTRAMARIPRSFEELCGHIVERCHFILKINPANYEGSVAQSVAGALFANALNSGSSSLSHPNAFDHAFDERESMFGEPLRKPFEEESRNGLGPVKLACTAVIDYAKHGALASPSVLSLMIKTRVSRIIQRIDGLSFYQKLLNTVTISSVQVDCLAPLRHALAGVSRDRRNDRQNSNTPLTSEFEKLSVMVNCKHHYMNNVEGCPPSIMKKLSDSFWRLYSIIVEILVEQTNQGSPQSPMLVQLALDSLCLDYRPQDHEKLVSTCLLRHLHNVFSISSLNRTAYSWMQTCSSEWEPSFEYEKRNESNAWDPWPPHVVRHALFSGTLSTREVICKIRETPSQYLSDGYWHRHNLLGSLEKVVSLHTVSTIVEAYDECLREAMKKKWKLSSKEFAKVERASVHVQAVFRGHAARKNVALMRSGAIGVSDHNLCTSFSDHSLVGFGQQIRRIRNGSWALFKLLSTLLLGGYRNDIHNENKTGDVTNNLGSNVAQNSLVHGASVFSTPFSSEKMESTVRLQTQIFRIFEEELNICVEILCGKDKLHKAVELMEVESYTHSLISFILSTSQARHLQIFLRRPVTLGFLCKLLVVGSPRIIGIVVLIFRNFASEVDPAIVDSAFTTCINNFGFQSRKGFSPTVTENISLVSFLLWRITRLTAQGCGTQPLHNIFGELDLTKNRFRFVSRAGSGYLVSKMACESLSLLRDMVSWDRWKDHIKESVNHILAEFVGAFEDLNCRVLDGDENRTGDPSKNSKVYLYAYVSAALGVMGGVSDMLRVGGLARFTHSAQGPVARVLNYTRGMPNALVVFKNSITATPQIVCADSLVPCDEVVVQEGSFPLIEGNELIQALHEIMKSKQMNPHERRSSLTGDKLAQVALLRECQMSYIRACAISALSVILQHVPSAQVARDTKLLSEMFVSALRPLNLSTFVSTPILAQRMRLLQEWAIEVCGKDGESMILDKHTPGALFESSEIVISRPNNISDRLTHERKIFDMALQVCFFHNSVYSMGLCVKAVRVTERNGLLDLERASSWLTTEEAMEAQYALKLEAQETSALVSERWERAAELAQQGAPAKLCYHALELFGDNVHNASDWLWQHGVSIYSQIDYYKIDKESNGHSDLMFDNKINDDETSLSWSCSVCTFLNEDQSATKCEVCLSDRAFEPTKPQSKRAQTLSSISSSEDQMRVDNLIGRSDIAPLEDIESVFDPLVEESSEEKRFAGARPASGSAGGTSVTGNDDEKAEDSATTADQVKLEPLCTVIWPGMLLIVSDSVGHEKMVSGRPGRVVEFECSDKSGTVSSVTLEMINPSTGMTMTRRYPIDRLRRPVELFGGMLAGSVSVLRLLLGTARSLSTLFAREAILSIIVDVDHTFSVEDLGGAQNLVSLLKFIAATDESFIGASLGDTTRENKKSKLFQLTRRLKKLLSEQVTTASDDNMLGDCMVTECMKNIRACFSSTDTANIEGVAMRESLHPAWPSNCAYSGEVHIEGAAAIQIKFDPAWTDRSWNIDRNWPGRCEDSRIELVFYADSACKSIIERFHSGKAPSSIIIESSSVFFKFYCNYMKESSLSSRIQPFMRGFKFFASPVRGWGMWINEDRVSKCPSLHWAFWLIKFFMNCGDHVSSKIHTSEIFEALVSYLRTPSAPFKDRIRSLLTQLCQSPWLFDRRPAFEALDGVTQNVMTRAESEHASHLFLPSGLPALVELCMTVRLCQQSFSTNTPFKIEPMNPEVNIDTPLDPPIDTKVSSVTIEYFNMLHDEKQIKPNREILFMGLINLVSHMSVNARLPDSLAICTWAHSELRNTKYSSDTLQKRVRTKRVHIERMVRSMSHWTREMDLQLVNLVNHQSKKKGFRPLSQHPSQLSISATELRDYSKLQTLSIGTIYQRLALLQLLNHLVDGLIVWIDTSNVAQPWSISAKLQKLNHTIFFHVKEKLFRSAIDMTWGLEQGSGLKVGLDQLSSDSSERLGLTDPEKSTNLFVQLHSQLHTVPVNLLRSHLQTRGGRGVQSLFEVQYVLGEGLDYGGLYRDAMNTIVDLLFSKTFSLLVVTPNGIGHEGLNQEKYVPNSGCSTPSNIRMFETVGKLMGISLRTEGYFPFKFPICIYKLLLSRSIDVRDIASIDAKEDSRPEENQLRRVDKIRLCKSLEEFESLGLKEKFVVTKASGKVVPLIPGGEKKRLNYKNRLSYCHLYDQERVHEFDEQVDAIRRGLACIVPFKALQYLTPSELEDAICGDADIDLELWKSHTKYQGVNFHSNSKIARMFWRVMETLSQQQRVSFIKFCWGRSRLPSRNGLKDWSFKISASNAPVTSLPIVHTCFFQIEMPKYDSDDVMRSKIVTAIEYGLGAMLNK